MTEGSKMKAACSRHFFRGRINLVMAVGRVWA